MYRLYFHLLNKNKNNHKKNKVTRYNSLYTFVTKMLDFLAYSNIVLKTEFKGFEHLSQL